MTPRRRFDAAEPARWNFDDWERNSEDHQDDEPGLIVDFPVLASWACAILAVVVVLAIGALR